MKLPALPFRLILSKTTLALFALGGFLFFASASQAKANASDAANRRVSYTHFRYHEAAEHFGPYSPAARHWAIEREQAYERLARCRHDWR